MDWSQWLFVSALVLATYTGRPALNIALPMWGNFLATFFLASTVAHVAVADILAASILAFGSRRAAVIALLFVIMLPVYALAHFYQWPNSATYAIIDLLAYLQLAIMGRWGDGIGILGRLGVRRDDPSLGSVSPGGSAFFRTRRNQVPSE